MYVSRYLYSFPCEGSSGPGLLHPDTKPGMDMILGHVEQTLVNAVATGQTAYGVQGWGGWISHPYGQDELPPIVSSA